MKKAALSGAVVLAALAIVAVALAVAGAPSGDGVQPTEVAMQPANACDGGQKIEGEDDVADGTFNVSFEGFAGTITIDVRNTASGKVFDFDTNDPGHLITSMYVKGGPTANFYNYLPTPGAQQADTGLHSPVNPNNGKYYGLSHLCIFTDKKGFGSGA